MKAKKHYDLAMQKIGESKINYAENLNYVAQLEQLEKDMKEFWTSGYNMFNAYSLSWDEGNIKMESFDKTADKVLNDVSKIVTTETEKSKIITNEIIEMSHSSITVTIIGVFFLSYLFDNINLFFVSVFLLVISVFLFIALNSIAMFQNDKVIDYEMVKKQNLTVVLCLNCQKENILEDQYCIYCGEKLEE